MSGNREGSSAAQANYPTKKDTRMNLRGDENNPAKIKKMDLSFLLNDSFPPALCPGVRATSSSNRSGDGGKENPNQVSVEHACASNCTVCSVNGDARRIAPVDTRNLETLTSVAATVEPGRAVCPYCDKNFAHIDGALKHVKRFHDRDGRRHCHRCVFSTTDTDLFNIHKNEHYMVFCRFCKRRFDRRGIEWHEKRCGRNTKSDVEDK